MGSGRGGIGALLAALRYTLGNPLVRLILRRAVERVDCRHGERCVSNTILYHALSRLAGEAVSCPHATSMVMDLIDALVKFGVRLMKGDPEGVARALRDPALRRGVSLVFEGIARYGVTVPQELPAPFMIVWNFTNMCNLRCRHCYQRADRPLPNELTLEEKLMVVDQLDRAGVASIALSGGEPTIHPHFERVVKEIADRGMYAAVASNGWRLADREFFERVKRLGLRYAEISVDSADPRKHDWFRGVEGSWQRAVRALENAVELGISHAMAITITRYNVDEVDDILDLAESIGVQRVVFFNFVPVGRGREIVEADLDPFEREEFMKHIYKEMRKRGIQIVTTAPQYGRITYQESRGSEVAPTHFFVGGGNVVSAVAEFVGGCGAGRIYAGLQPDGTLVPCVFLPIPVGNLRESDFRSLWDNAPLFRTLRNRELLKGACRDCPFRNVCGGCRARAFAYFRDVTAPDPGCIYNIKYWREIAAEYGLGVRTRASPVRARSR